MPFARFIILCLLISTHTWSVLPSDLVFTPTAEFPKRGQTELGYQFTYYSIKAITNDKGFYFNHSISKNIRYGAEFYENGSTQKVFHHFAYRLGQVFPNSRYHLIFSGAFNYLGRSEADLINERVFDGSLTTTWAPPENPFKIHLTIARKLKNQSFIALGALSFAKDWGHLSMEWDGSFINLSSQFNIYNRLNFRAGVTKDTGNSTELLFKTGVGFTDFLPLKKADKINPITNEPLQEPKISTVDTSIGLNHIQEGLEFFYAGEIKKAQKSYEIAVEFFPESAVVHERLGSIYYRQGDFDKALIQWRKANVLAPSERLKQFIKDAKAKDDSRYE